MESMEETYHTGWRCQGNLVGKMEVQMPGDQNAFGGLDQTIFPLSRFYIYILSPPFNLRV